MASDKKDGDSQTGMIIMLICMLAVGIAALFLIVFAGDSLPNLNPNKNTDSSLAVVRTTKAADTAKSDNVVSNGSQSDSQESKNSQTTNVKADSSATAAASATISATAQTSATQAAASGKERVNDELTYIKTGYDSDTVWGDFLSIYFDYTNNEKENKICGFVYDIKVFQNGGQLETTLLQTTNESKAYYNEVLPGSTVRVAQHLSAPADKTSPITVQVTKMFSKKVIWQKQIQIKDL